MTYMMMIFNRDANITEIDSKVMGKDVAERYGKFINNVKQLVDIITIFLPIMMDVIIIMIIEC